MKTDVLYAASGIDIVRGETPTMHQPRRNKHDLPFGEGFTHSAEHPFTTAGNDERQFILRLTMSANLFSRGKPHMIIRTKHDANIR